MITTHVTSVIIVLSCDISSSVIVVCPVTSVTPLFVLWHQLSLYCPVASVHQLSLYVLFRQLPHCLSCDISYHCTTLWHQLSLNVLWHHCMPSTEISFADLLTNWTALHVVYTSLFLIERLCTLVCSSLFF